MSRYDEAQITDSVHRERRRLNALGFDLPLADPQRRSGPIAELKALLADRLVYWAFRLDRERFRL